jgi:hypothetical protein
MINPEKAAKLKQQLMEAELHHVTVLHHLPHDGISTDVSTPEKN